MAVTAAGTLVNLGVVSHHQVQLVTEEVSLYLGNLGVALQKKVRWAWNFRPTFCGSSSIIYIRRCLKIPHCHWSSLQTTQNVSRWPGCYKMQGLVCSLKVYIGRCFRTNSSLCLHRCVPSVGRSFLISAPERARQHMEHTFHWFLIMSLKLLQKEGSGSEDFTILSLPSFSFMVVSGYRILSGIVILEL